MAERIVSLEEVDYRVFFGTKESLFEFIKYKFPDVKITSRGSKIKVTGDSAHYLDICDKVTVQDMTVGCL